MLAIRFHLARENKRRDAEPVDETYDDVYIEVILPDGKRVERKVSKVTACQFSHIYLNSYMLFVRNSWTSRMYRIAISATFCDKYYELTSLYYNNGCLGALPCCYSSFCSALCRDL